jgi:putative oxidoreductase
VLAGFLTRYAAFIASGEMAVAYFLMHVRNGVWPILNDGELAALYCFVFLFVAGRGAWVCSIDSLLQKARTAAQDKEAHGPVAA